MHVVGPLELVLRPQVGIPIFFFFYTKGIPFRNPATLIKSLSSQRSVEANNPPSICCQAASEPPQISLRRFASGRTRVQQAKLLKVAAASSRRLSSFIPSHNHRSLASKHALSQEATHRKRGHGIDAITTNFGPSFEISKEGARKPNCSGTDAQMASDSHAHSDIAQEGQLRLGYLRGNVIRSAAVNIGQRAA